MKVLTKRIWRIFLWFSLISITIFFLLSFFIQWKGKDFFNRRISQLCSVPVSIREVRFFPPLSLVLYDVKVADFAEIRKIIVGLGAVELFTKNKKLYFTGVILERPWFFFVEDAEGHFHLGKTVQQKERISLETEKNSVLPKEVFFKKERSSEGIFIKWFKARGGRLTFFSLRNTSEKRKVNIDNILLTAHNLSFPTMTKKVEFALKGILRSGGESSYGGISATGWLFWPKRDLDAKVKFTNIDGRLFSILYKGNEDDSLKSFLANVEADLNSRNNRLKVNCVLAVQNIRFQSMANKNKDESLEKMILEGLKKSGKEFKINFSFVTSLDHFNIDNLPFSGNILK